MTETILWQENNYLQEIFDIERLKISQSNHPLAINYSGWFDSSEIIAYTMTIDNNVIQLCSTIGRKSYWPEGVYRVLNRLFKGTPEDIVTKNINDYWKEHVKVQIAFLEKMPGFKTAIISRKKGYKRALGKFKNELQDQGTEFTLYKNPIWVCNDCHNVDCLQDVLFYGIDCLDKFGE